MRIGIDARFYGSIGKGLGRYTEKLIKHLDHDQSSEHTYIIFLRRENFDEYQPTNERYVKVLADYPWYGWQEQFLFPLLISQYRLDLIHFPHFNVPILVTTPFVVTIHDLILLHFPTVKATELPPFLYWLKYLAYRLVISLALWRAELVIAVSQFTAADLKQVYSSVRNKVVVTPEAADPYCFWLSPRQEQSLFVSLGLVQADESVRPYVLYVGNAYPHKNLRMIIELATTFPDYEFVCVGKEDYFYRNFKEEVHSARCENIRFVGYLDDRSLGALYRRARLYFFPSLYEGFGLPGLEAMTYGIPVLAANAGSLPEIYGEAAYYFDPPSVKDCQKIFQQAINESGRGDLRGRRFNRAAQFSWERMALATRRFYENIESKRKT